MSAPVCRTGRSADRATSPGLGRVVPEREREPEQYPWKPGEQVSAQSLPEECARRDEPRREANTSTRR